MTAPNLSLYNIETGLNQLFQVRAEAEAEGDAEAVAACDTEIAAYVEAEVRKVDGIAQFIRQCDRSIEDYNEEIERLIDGRKRWKDRRQRTLDMVEHVMRDILHEDKLQGRFSTLVVRKNPSSLEVTQEDLVPDRFRRFTVTLSAMHRLRLLDVLGNSRGGRALAEELTAFTTTAIANSSVKDALKKGEVVPGAKLVDDKYRVEVL